MNLSSQPAESPSPGTMSTGVGRAIRVLYFMSDSDQTDFGVSDIARQLGMSKAGVHRVLTTLYGCDFVAYDPESRRYRLGPGAIRVGLAAVDRLQVTRIARPYLEGLVEVSEETATLSARTGDQRVYLDQVLSPREIRMAVQLGRPMPLYAGASSKAILAGMPDSELDDYLDRMLLTPMTERTILDATALREDVHRVRERGFSLSLGERQEGAAAVAAPFFYSSGVVFGSISLCGPATRLSPRLVQSLGRRVQEAASALSQDLGARDVQ